jgi:hypothetical protein
MTSGIVFTVRRIGRKTDRSVEACMVVEGEQILVGLGVS